VYTDTVVVHTQPRCTPTSDEGIAPKYGGEPASNFPRVCMSVSVKSDDSSGLSTFVRCINVGSAHRAFLGESGIRQLPRRQEAA
jgi:hypothetical protein